MDAYLNSQDKYSNAEGIKDALRIARVFLRPPDRLLPSEWAERNIKIPLGNAIPGMVRFDNAPYQREPLDVLADHRCDRVTLMWGAQLGKTLVLNCGIGYFIAHEPHSQMMMQPSQGDLNTWLETKFNPIVDNNDILKNRIAKPRSREGVNNQQMKSYPGGFLMFSWSGSPRTMRGRSAPKIYCDEVDGYDYTAEGHPVNLLWQRAATFGDLRKLLVTSTPTVAGSSFVETSYNDGDMRQFWLTCPHCKEKITLNWSNVVWDKDEDGSGLPDTAAYSCQECGSVITDADKIAMLKTGEWIAQKKFTGHASFHLNELYSSFRRWSDIVRSFLEKKANNDIQTFVNVSLAETWKESGEGVQHDTLFNRREQYDAPPDDVLVIVAAVDTQDDRLELEYVGYGMGFESWGLGYHIIHGDPSGSKVWAELDAALLRTFETEDGRTLSVSATGIDSGGHHTQMVYNFCKDRKHRRVWALKGVGGEGRPIVTAPSRKKGPNTRPVDLYTVGSDQAKATVFSFLRVKEPGHGYCHFPMSYDEEYFAQLTAEEVRTRFRKGFAVREWVKTRPRNEALDIRQYALATLTILNPMWDVLKKKRAWDESTEPKRQAIDTSRVAQKTKARHNQKRRGGFANSWR